ncbi:hypothetical protein ACI65C_006413 [Semiaphis heraclei]
MSRKSGVKCAYLNCGKTARSYDGLKMYRFSKDKSLCTQWVANSGVVCSNYFSTDSFAAKTFVQSTAGFSPITSRRLLPNAIPLSTFGYYYDDIPYNRMSSSNSPSSIIIRTPSGPFTVTKSNDFSLKTQCCSNLEINFSKLCDELEVEPLCEDEMLENNNEEFQKSILIKNVSVGFIILRPITQM